MGSIFFPPHGFTQFPERNYSRLPYTSVAPRTRYQMPTDGELKSSF